MRLSTLAAACALLLAVPASAQSSSALDAKKAMRSETTGSSVTSSPPTAATSSGALFFDGFEASAGTPGDPIVGWVTENVNGDERAWEALGSATNATRIHTGDAAAAVFWNPELPADDWLISPGFDVTAGTSYTVSFWFKPGDDGFGTAESIEVAVGTSQTASGLTNVILDLDAVVAGDYQEHSATFTPMATGTVYLGFHCNSTADQYFCAIDDVQVDPTPSGPVLSASPTTLDFGNVPVGTTVEETVTVTNVGSSLLTISSTSIEFNPPFNLGDVSTYDVTLEAGESTTFGVTFSPTADGLETGQAVISSDDPASPGAVSLSGTGVSAPSNDDAANATVINSAGTYTGSTAFSSTEAGEPDPSCASSFGSSVFFDYTAGGAGTIDISLDGSDFDTILTLHNPADLAELACNDDDVGLTSGISGFTVANGTRVLIRIGGYQAFGNGEGAFTMTLTENFGTAVGDDPDAAFALGAPRPNPTAGTFRMDLRMATPEAVRVSVYDLLGREVAVVHDGAVAAGTTPLTGQLDVLPAGQYLVRATGASFVTTRALSVVR